jgi:hypothetical protein
MGGWYDKLVTELYEKTAEKTQTLEDHCNPLRTLQKLVLVVVVEV